MQSPRTRRPLGALGMHTLRGAAQVVGGREQRHGRANDHRPVFDIVKTAREARLLWVASKKVTTSNAYHSGAKHYKVSQRPLSASLTAQCKAFLRLTPAPQEWCQKTPGAHASLVTDAQTAAYARYCHDACLATVSEPKSALSTTTASTSKRWRTSARTAPSRLPSKL